MAKPSRNVPLSIPPCSMCKSVKHATTAAGRQCYCCPASLNPRSGPTRSTKRITSTTRARIPKRSEIWKAPSPINHPPSTIHHPPRS